MAELREVHAQIGDRFRRLTGVLVDDRRPGTQALAAMRNADPLVLMDVPGRKQRVAAEQPREQLLFLDVERHHRREVGLPRQLPACRSRQRPCIRTPRRPRTHMSQRPQWGRSKKPASMAGAVNFESCIAYSFLGLRGRHPVDLVFPRQCRFKGKRKAGRARLLYPAFSLLASCPAPAG